MDQVYTLPRILAGAWEFAQPVHMYFVNLEGIRQWPLRWSPGEGDTGSIAMGCLVPIQMEQEFALHCQ